MKAFLIFLKLVGYGQLFMVLCQLLSGIVGVHTLVNLFLGIAFVMIGESK